MQAVEEPLREQEMTQMIDPEGHFVGLLCLPFESGHTRIIDQQVEWKVKREYFPHAVPNRVKIVEGKWHKVGALACPKAHDLVDHRLGSFGGSTGQDELIASFGEPERGDAANPCIGACNEGNSLAHC